MGRAARTKRQRGQTRTWHTRNPWTGKLETFPVCISDEALREWEENRVRLAKAGYPDRPPEFDSPRHRVWHDENPGHPLRRGDWDGVVQTLGADPTAKALGTWQTGDGRVGIKINVGRRDDGGFVFHLVMQLDQEEVVNRVNPIPNEAAARAIVQGTNADIAALLGLPPLRWTSADEVLAEIAEAA